MSLSSLAIAYFSVPPSVLKLSSKLSVLAALALYRTGSMESLFDSPYRKRQRTDVLYELKNRRVVDEDGKAIAFEWDEFTKDSRIQLPTKFDYDKLSLPALKVLLAAERLGKYQKNRFRFSCTQSHFMETACLWSKGRFVEGIKELTHANLIQVKQAHKMPSTYSLLDPDGSGVSRYFMARHMREQWDGYTVAERFSLIFGETIKAPDLDQGNRTYVTTCPWCHKPKKLRIHVRDDRYECHSCNVAGNSERLYIKWVYAAKRDWAKSLKRLPSSYNPELNFELQGEAI